LMGADHPPKTCDARGDGASAAIATITTTGRTETLSICIVRMSCTPSIACPIGGPGIAWIERQVALVGGAFIDTRMIDCESLESRCSTLALDDCWRYPARS
jgi:hypothetical protein